MEDPDYNVFPSMTIGGPTGDYFLECPVTSGRWVEYKVVQVVNGSGDIASIVISGDSVPVALAYDGSRLLSNDVSIRGQAYRVPINSTLVGQCHNWDRVTHSQKRVYIRIDGPGAAASAFVTIKFRVKLLTIIPGPTETTHPDLGHQLNIQRAENIRAHLDKNGTGQAGIPQPVERIKS